MAELKINKAISRSIDILEYIAHQKEGVTLATLSKELSLPKSSVFDIVHTLAEKKMLRFHEDSKSYFLDLKTFEIGNAYLSKNDIHALARPFLKDISKKTGETVFLAMENNGMIVYLDKVEGSSPTRTTCSIGDRNMMYCTGLGKAILATYPLEKVRMVTGGGNLQSHTSNTLKNFAQLIENLEEIRKRGYSIDNQEDNDYVFCVAGPIMNAGNKCVAAISISCIYTPAIQEKIDFYSQLITGAALEISGRLGYLKPYLFPNESYNLFQ